MSNPIQKFRTHTCGQLRSKNINQEVILSGWVHSRRDHGGVIFIDLRDRYGLTQVTFRPEVSKEALKMAESIRSEFVIKVKGKVRARPKEMVNPKLKTGEIEVEAKEIEILSKAKTPPFSLTAIQPYSHSALQPLQPQGQTVKQSSELASSRKQLKGEVNEEVRLKYRYLDLRRSKLQKNIIFRSKMIKFIRDWMHQNDFIEIETPILTVSSPEGARDYLVPSRIHKGKFYALPQAPQQYKQLLMIAGFDRYFQIAPCFRDEDPRADRAPGEFYQLDVETSFLTKEEFFELMEPLLIDMTEKLISKKVLTKPFPKIPYKEALLKYGTDRPDLRFGLEIEDISSLVKNCGFKVFSDAVKNKGVVRALNVKAGAKLSRAEIDELTKLVKETGAGGLAYIKLNTPPAALKSGVQSPIVKFLGDKLTQRILTQMKAEAGDIVFLGAGEEKIVCQSLAALRSKLGRQLKLIDKNIIAWAWIVDFPMYEFNEQENRIDFSHNPFSMPSGGLKSLDTEDPLNIIAEQYDIIANGYEISSGAVRNFKPEIMHKAFGIAGYSKKEVDEKFGHMISAFKYGAPPHCGFAPGIERMLMVLLNESNIREVAAFPKNGKAQEVMMGAPGEVESSQLKDLGIELVNNQ